MNKQIRVASPIWAPASPGGLYLKKGPRTYSAFALENRELAKAIKALMRDFIDFPALKPHLVKWGLCLKVKQNGLRFCCIVCENKRKTRCKCPESVNERRRHRFPVEIWKDPAVRPLFDKRGLAVQVGRKGLS